MNRKPPYYRVRNGRGYFELGLQRAAQAEMKTSYPLGEAGPSAIAAGWFHYAKYREAMCLPTLAPPAPACKRGTLGHWFTRFKTKERFLRYRPATQREYDFYWESYIAPEFGDLPLNKISPAQFERFHLDIEARYGVNVRWHVVKVARSIFNSAVNYHLLDRSPCQALPNKKPPPRSAFWIAQDVRRLIQTASDHGYEAMALGIRLCWETLMSPVDVRTLSLKNLKRDGEGGYIETVRAKTSAPIYAAVSTDLYQDLIAYVDGLPVTLKPDAPILRTSRARTAYTRTRFSDEFRLVRELALGKGETRKLMDLRRSGNIEADLGGATAEERAEILANTLDKDPRLEATYTPGTVTRARKLAKQRDAGRALLLAESMKRNSDGGGVLLKTAKKPNEINIPFRQ